MEATVHNKNRLEGGLELLWLCAWELICLRYSLICMGRPPISSVVTFGMAKRLNLHVAMYSNLRCMNSSSDDIFPPHSE
jgi:hypothetical protein